MLRAPCNVVIVIYLIELIRALAGTLDSGIDTPVSH